MTGIVSGSGIQTGSDASLSSLALTRVPAVSQSSLTISGTPQAGGSATTNFPLLYLNTTGASAVTTFSTAGTFIGGNAPSGFAGNWVDFHNNGGSSVFSITQSGSTTIGSHALMLSGSRTSTAWTTTGTAFTNNAATFTDTTSNGTVAAQYVNAFKAPTIGASSATTYTNSYNTYFEAPVAGTNVTQTNAWALGADTLKVNGAFSPSQTAGIIGTTTNNDANAGSVGEYIESRIIAGSAVSLVDATAKNLTSISLTAGDWEVYSLQAYTGNAATTVTGVQTSISTTTNTIDSTEDRVNSNSFTSYTPFGITVGRLTQIIGPVRFSLSATTTIYSVARLNFAINTASVYGILRARRVR